MSLGEGQGDMKSIMSLLGTIIMKTDSYHEVPLQLMLLSALIPCPRKHQVYFVNCFQSSV